MNGYNNTLGHKGNMDLIYQLLIIVTVALRH